MEVSQSVLVVEDEVLILIAVADDLRALGLIVHEAKNASEAISILETHREIRLLFTDIDMPGTMDGLRLSAYVRDRWPPIKIIITSGKRPPGADFIPEGGVFLPKPYATGKLAETMRQLMATG